MSKVLHYCDTQIEAIKAFGEHDNASKPQHQAPTINGLLLLFVISS
jgi:hypothetical protein